MPLVSALGCAVHIDTSTLGEREACEILKVWAGAAQVPTDPAPASHRTIEVHPVGDLALQLFALSSQLTLEAIEARRGELWMLHAAAVADDQGRVVAVIGPSGRGKTTAATALGRVYGYVSDETVGVDAEGVVHPYRKPLSVIEEGLPVKSQRPPNDLGLRELPVGPLRLAALVLLDRRADAPEIPVVTTCDFGEALPELIAQTSYVADLPDPLRTIAAHTNAVGGIRRVVYREAETLPVALAPLFVDPAPACVPEPILAATNVEPDTSGTFRGVFLDAVDVAPDRIALLQPDLPHGSTLRVIAGIAPAIWRAASGVSLGRLVEVARETYGDPKDVDAASVVASAIGELRSQGVLANEPSWRLREDIAWTGEPGRYVALQLSDLSDPTPVALEGSAAMIWEVLSESRGMTAVALTEEVARRAGVERAVVSDDVNAFLSSLRSSRLVECVAP